MKRLLMSFTACLFFLSFLLALVPMRADAAVNYNRLIDDSVFSDSSKMSAAQIDSFLNSFPDSCISLNNGFKAPEPIGYNPTDRFTYGSKVSAGTVIYDSSRVYGLNPQVLLTTLQKEQDLVTGGAGCHSNNPNPSWPFSSKPSGGHTFNCSMGGETVLCTYACPYSGGCINIAVGYGCPGYCNTAVEGFTKQIIRAAWLLKFGQQRSLGNASWNVQLTNFPHSGNVWDNSDDPPYCRRDLPMTEGYRVQCSGDASTYYDGYTTLSDGSNVHIDTGGTAALYWYTPFKSGNSHFVNIFSDWFGNPAADTSKDGVISGDWGAVADGIDSPTIKRGAEYFFDNDMNGVADYSFDIGRSTDRVMVGNWDGSSGNFDKEIGLRRDDHYFLLGTSGSVAYDFIYGKSSDQAFASDWDGNGTDTIGLKRGSDYYFYTSNSTVSRKNADSKISIGRSTDQLIIGDWSGSQDGIGLRRGNYFFFDSDNNGKANSGFAIGRKTDRVIVGDWDGNGTDNIGLKRDNRYILLNNVGVPIFDFVMGRATDRVIVGDWDGNGTDTISLKRASNYYIDNGNDGNPDPSASFVYTF